MKSLIGSLLVALCTLPTLSTAGDYYEWPQDAELRSAYSSELLEGRLGLAALRILNWCTSRYEKGLADGKLTRAAEARLVIDIREAAQALEFISDHRAEIRALEDGTNTYGLCLGCFDVLFGLQPIRDGDGDRYERFIKAYNDGREVTERILSEDAKVDTRQENAEQGVVRDPPPAPSSAEPSEE